MNNPTDTNQASEDDQNKRDIIAALANDYYEQLKNDTPYINMTFEEAGCACRDFAKQDVEELIRTEKLKLLAEVRELVIGEDLPPDVVTDSGIGYSRQQFAINMGKAGQRKELNKLEAEL